MKQIKYIKYKDWKIKLVFEIFEKIYFTIFLFKKLSNGNKKTINIKKIDNILVIRRDMIWDFIISFSALVKLKTAFPEANIHFIWTKWIRSIFEIIDENFFSSINFIDPNFWMPKFIRSKTQYLQKKTTTWDDLIEIMKMKWKIDLWIDLRWDIFSLKLLNSLECKRIISNATWWWFFFIDDIVEYNTEENEKNHDLSIINHVINKYSEQNITNINTSPLSILKKWIIVNKKENDKYICIQPGWWRWNFKRWSQNSYVELIRKILEEYKDINIYLLYADNLEEIITKSIKNKLQETNRVKIVQSKNWESAIDIIDNSILFIGHDTSTAHLCDLLEHSWIILFWPWDRKLFSPDSDNISIIFKEYPCQPCEQRKCIYPENSCINAIKVDEILFEIQNLLNLND